METAEGIAVTGDGRARRGESTRARLVGIATELFARDGYEATTMDAILAASGSSKGAVYHHFGAGKEALFEAVFASVEARVIAEVTAAAGAMTTAQDALAAGCKAWLRLAGDPVVRRVVLIDAPAALGWTRWRELDEVYALGLLRAGVEVLATETGMSPALVDPFAHVLLAAANELALVVAHAADPKAAVEAANATVDILLGSFAPA